MAVFVSQALLQHCGACEGQEELFAEVFGKDSVAVTKEVVTKAIECGLEWRWFIAQVFHGVGMGPLLLKSDEVRNSLWGTRILRTEEEEAKLVAVYAEKMAPEIMKYLDGLGPSNTSCEQCRELCFGKDLGRQEETPAS